MQVPAQFKELVLEVLSEYLSDEELDMLEERLSRDGDDSHHSSFHLGESNLVVNFSASKATSDHCDQCDAVSSLHSRPLYVISSNQYTTLEEAIEQLREWFFDGAINPLTAVYKIETDELGRELVNPFYVISSTELDSYREAQDQIYSWLECGTLDKKARIYKTELANCLELDITLIPATDREEIAC